MEYTLTVFGRVKAKFMSLENAVAIGLDMCGECGEFFICILDIQINNEPLWMYAGINTKSKMNDIILKLKEIANKANFKLFD